MVTRECILRLFSKCIAGFSIDRKQFVQRNIKTEFSKFEKYKDAIPHGGCVL